MLIDDFTHQHFAPHIRVEAVNGKAGVHNLTALVVEVGFQVDEVGLIAHPVVDLLEFGFPLFIRSRMEGELDIGRIYGHQGQENGADVVGFAFCFDGVQVIDDDIRVDAACPQAVGAGENQEIQRLVGQYILVKTLECHGGGIAAAPEIQAGKIKVGGVAVFQRRR